MKRSKFEYQHIWQALLNHLAQPFFTQEESLIKLSMLFNMQSHNPAIWVDQELQKLANNLNDEDTEIQRLTNLAIGIRLLSQYKDLKNTISNIIGYEENNEKVEMERSNASESSESTDSVEESNADTECVIYFYKYGAPISNSFRWLEDISSVRPDIFYMICRTIKHLKHLSLEIDGDVSRIPFAALEVLWNGLQLVAPTLAGLRFKTFPIAQASMQRIHLIAEMIRHLKLIYIDFDFNHSEFEETTAEKFDLIFNAVKTLKPTLKAISYQFPEVTNISLNCYAAAAAMLEHLNVDSIDLSGNEFCDYPSAAIDALSVAIQSKTKLKLNLARTGISDCSRAQLTAFCGLLQHKDLSELNLSGNGLGYGDLRHRDEVTSIFKAIMTSSQHLTALDLTANRLEKLTENNFALMCELAKNPTLRTFRVGLDTPTAMTFAKYHRLFADLKSSRLEVVRLFASNTPILPVSLRTMLDELLNDIRLRHEFPEKITGIGMVFAQLAQKIGDAEIQRYILAWILEWVVGRPLRNAEHQHVIRLGNYMGGFFCKKAEETTNKREKCSP